VVAPVGRFVPQAGASKMAVAPGSDFVRKILAQANSGVLTMRAMVLAVLVALASVSLATGQEKAGRILDLWDVAYLQGGRAGYVHTFTDEMIQKDTKVLRTAMELRLTLQRFKDTVEIGMDTGTVEHAQGGAVTGVFLRQYLGKMKQLEITGTVEGRVLRLVQDGSKPLHPAPWNDEVVGLYRQQTLLRDRGAKPGERFSYPSFEASINLVLTNQVTVKDYEEVEVFGGSERRKLLRVESRPQRVEKVQLPDLITWVDADLKQVRAEVEIPGLGKVTLYRTTREKALSPSAAPPRVDLGLSQLVRLKQRIARPYDTVAASYRIQIRDDDDPASTFVQDERQQVKNVQNNSFELHVRAGGTGLTRAAVPEPGPEYLQSSYFINSDDGRVQQLARLAIGDAQAAGQKAARIERWVHDHMKTVNHEALAPSDQVARTLQGDCTEHAMLTAAMCRAAGVPARTAVGLIYADVSAQPTFAFHMWTEVWVGGRWLPLDATLGRGFVGATHLKIAAQSWHDTRTMTPLFPVVRVLGRVSIEVLHVEGR
jgi:transglutaminase-like putative cysteine protease